MTKLFKQVDQRLLEDAANISKRVAKQIERGFTIKQMMDWMKKPKNRPTTANSFEELLSKIEQEVSGGIAN